MWAKAFGLCMKTQFETQNGGSHKCLEKLLHIFLKSFLWVSKNILKYFSLQRCFRVTFNFEFWIFDEKIVLVWQNLLGKIVCITFFFTIIDLIMPEISHDFEGFFLIFLLDVTSGECLMYKKLIFLRNNSKDKSVLFLQILR